MASKKNTFTFRFCQVITGNVSVQQARGGGGFFYISLRCMCRHIRGSGRVFAPFWSENGYTLAHFGLESGMVFEGTT